ncbi:hypothetical protein OEA41_009120 [Lepraria neglecta]|uniref:Rhodopsin domain-containing protein n=1 Tax=Lepraria neglecta TaxID=209136 RepID=A0AAE0DHD0_9LECA|nr:hypothetical protein OEA41_009120 [Lepraria neglecta]
MADNSTVSAPLGAITPTNHSGLIHITNAFGLILVLISMIIRVFVRLFIAPPFDRDDIALGVATVDRWKIIGAFDIAIEVALFAMPILLVKGLKMALVRKITIVVVFGLRLPMIAFTLLRLHSLDIETPSNDLTLSLVYFVIWTLVEVDISFCSSNIACLKPFMAAFNTSYGGVEEINALSNIDRSNYNKSGLSTITSLKFGTRSKNRDGSQSQSKRRSRSVGSPHAEPQLRWDTMRKGDVLGHEAEVSHEDTESMGSHGSRQMIIQKDVTYNVEYNTPDIARTRTGEKIN